jgi:hypothetical protein
VISASQIIYTEPNLAWKIATTGDYNSDGKADLLWRNDSTGQVFMQLMNGLSIIAGQAVYTEPSSAWRIIP